MIPTTSYQLTLTEAATQLVVDLLASQPINVAGDLFAELRRQVEQQDAARLAAAREAARAELELELREQLRGELEGDQARAGILEAAELQPGRVVGAVAAWPASAS